MPSFELETIIEAITSYLGGSVSGYDTDGKDYDSLEQMWIDAGLLKKKKGEAPVGEDEQENGEAQQEEIGEEQPWYSQAFDYWEVCNGRVRSSSMDWV